MSRARLALAIAAMLALAAGYITFPWTREQCIEWAANRPSNVGAAYAFDLCKERFPEAR